MVYLSSMKLLTNRLSPSYVALIDLLHRTRSTIRTSNNQIIQEGGTFALVDTGVKSDRLNQEFYMAASELWEMCSPHEWHLVGRIAAELKANNVLWYCDPDLKKNSSLKRSLRSLIKMKVLIPTETLHIYIVNPFYIRRGDFFVVLNTTANLLQDVVKVEREHIKEKKAVKNFDTTMASIGLQIEQELKQQNNGQEPDQA